MTTNRPRASQRNEYGAFHRISTRWGDNDLYGHVNNVIYYTWFDTAVNALLIERGALDIQRGGTVGFVVETHCSYFRPVAFPTPVEIGIRVGSIGTSSVRYEMAVFVDDMSDALAQGHFVHVYVDRTTQRPVPLPPVLRRVVQDLACHAHSGLQTH
jgi:acyl-CoA thioester hydrolase